MAITKATSVAGYSHLRGAVLIALLVIPASGAFAQTTKAQRSTFDPMFVLVENRVLVCQSRVGLIDCSGAKSAGELHNAGLKVAMSPGAKAGVGRDGRTPIDILLDRLRDWLGNSGIMKPGDQSVSGLSQAIVGQFQGASVLSRERHFSPESIRDVGCDSVVVQLRRSGAVSSEFAATLGRLAQSNATPQQFQAAFSPGRWEGKDKLAAALFLDIKTSSRRYWENAGGAAGVSKEDLWDAIGALLLIESGPGAIVGGIALSALVGGVK